MSEIMRSKENMLLGNLLENIEGLKISKKKKQELQTTVVELSRAIVESADYEVRREYTTIYNCGTKYLPKLGYGDELFGEGTFTKELRRDIGLSCFIKALNGISWVRGQITNAIERFTKERDGNV